MSAHILPGFPPALVELVNEQTEDRCEGKTREREREGRSVVWIKIWKKRSVVVSLSLPVLAQIHSDTQMKIRRVSFLLILCLDITHSSSSSSSRERVQSFTYCRFLPGLILLSDNFSQRSKSRRSSKSQLKFERNFSPIRNNPHGVLIKIPITMPVRCRGGKPRESAHGLSSAKTKKKFFFQNRRCDCCSRLDNSIKFYLFEINNER